MCLSVSTFSHLDLLSLSSLSSLSFLSHLSPFSLIPLSSLPTLPSHIELLVNHHSIQKALVVINNMLKNLKYQMFVHIAADHTARAVGATTLMEEYMDASNFGVCVGVGVGMGGTLGCVGVCWCCGRDMGMLLVGFGRRVSVLGIL